MGSRNGVEVILTPLLVCMLVSSAWIFPATAAQKTSPWNSGRDLEKDDDTVRADPLNNFNNYRGGYNITNKHYWSSIIFTGVAGYGIGGAWAVCGVAYGGYLVATLCCGKRKEKLKKKPNSGQTFYLWAILLAGFFSLLAIVGCGVVIGGSSGFDREAKDVVKIVMETAKGASNTIKGTTAAMEDMVATLQASSGGGSSEGTSAVLTSTSQKLHSQAANIQSRARKNRRFIHDALNTLYVVTMVTICLNLGAVIAVAVCGILRLRRPFYLFIFLCWFLTVLSWLIFGFYLSLDNFSSDTCTALEMFQENPNNNSLSSILPCEQLLTAKSVLTNLSSEIYELVNEVNTQISVSYPDIALVCNPFSAPPYYAYEPQNCAANTIRIGDIPKVLKLLGCSDGGGCENGQFMSNSDYKTVEAYTSSIQGFLNVYPEMESLVECQTVKDAFSKILVQHCMPLKRYAHMVWAGLVLVSVVMVCLVLVWTIKANIEQKLHLSDGSVQPNSSTPKMMEMANDRNLG